MIWACGWGGGKQLVSDSYAAKAKRRQEEQPRTGARRRRPRREAEVGRRRRGRSVSTRTREGPGWTPAPALPAAASSSSRGCSDRVAIFVAARARPRRIGLDLRLRAGRRVVHRGAERAPASARRGAAAPVHARYSASARAVPRRRDAAPGGAGQLGPDGRLLLVGARRGARRRRRSAWSCRPVFGTNDDDTYSLRVVERIARRSGERVVTDTPGIVFLEIDGLALPVLQRGDAGRACADDGALARGRHAPAGRVGAGSLLADRRLAGRASCSARTRTSSPSAGSRRSGRWSSLLVAAGLRRDRAPSCRPDRVSSRTAARAAATCFSGEADHLILTVSRMEAEQRREPRLPRLLRERLQRGADARPRSSGR